MLRCGSGPGTRTAIWRSEWTSWRICCNAHSVRSKGFLVSRLGWVSPGERTTPPRGRKGLTGWGYGCGTGAGIDASEGGGHHSVLTSVQTLQSSFHPFERADAPPHSRPSWPPVTQASGT